MEKDRARAVSRKCSVAGCSLRLPLAAVDAEQAELPVRPDPVQALPVPDRVCPQPAPGRAVQDGQSSQYPEEAGYDATDLPAPMSVADHIGDERLATWFKQHPTFCMKN